MNENDFPKKIRAFIFERNKALGVSQADLARATGKTDQEISDVGAGRRAPFKAFAIFQILRSLHIDLLDVIENGQSSPAYAKFFADEDRRRLVEKDPTARRAQTLMALMDAFGAIQTEGDAKYWWREFVVALDSVSRQKTDKRRRSGNGA